MTELSVNTNNQVYSSSPVYAAITFPFTIPKKKKKHFPGSRKRITSNQLNTNKKNVKVELPKSSKTDLGKEIVGPIWRGGFGGC